MLRNLTTRRKLALVLWGVALLAFVLAAAGLMVFQRVTLERRARQMVEPYAELISVGADAAVAFEDPVRAQQILETLRANPVVVRADIVLDGGRVLASYRAASAAGFRAPLKAGLGVYVSGENVGLVRILQRGARLHIAMNAGELSRQARQITALFGVGFLALLLITVGQFAVLDRAIIRPLARLAAASERARTLGDYHQRVPAAGHDEAARLGQSFNALMEAVLERETALRRSLTFQRTLLQNAAYGIVSVTPAGLVTSFNPAAEELLGYPAAEVVGTTTPVCWHDPRELEARAAQLSRELGEPVAPGLEALVAKARRQQHDESEWTVVRRDGAHIPVLQSVAALRDDQGQVTGFVSLMSDLTDRKRAAAQIHHLKNYLSDIVDSMPAILVGVDRQAKVTQWNRGAEAATGLEAAAALGRPAPEVLPDFARWLEAHREDIALGRAASAEKLLVEREGERRYFDLMLYPLVATGIGGAVIRIEDVTEQTRISELMIQTEKMMSVGGLAAGMAHEINNPLGIIAQAAENIERRVDPGFPANRTAAERLGFDLAAMAGYLAQRQVPAFIASIREATARASRIIGNMLHFSRGGRAIMERASLADVVDRTLALADHDYDLLKKYDFRAIDVVRDIAPDVPSAPMVVVEIEQVLLNLLRNAAQAFVANPPGRAPRIHVRIRREDRYAVLDVEDNGPGMTEEIRRRVFEPFFTTKEPGIGTGLGLSVAYVIVTQNHKGLMEVHSTPGSGARFTVRLPLCREDARD